MFQPVFKCKENGVPDVYRKDLELIGENIIFDFAPNLIDHPGELDIDSFVEIYRGMTLDFPYLSCNTKYLGMCIFNETDSVIVYNKEKNCAEYYYAKPRTILIDRTLLEAERLIHRYRFTLAHEASHDILDSNYFGYNPNQASLFEDEHKPPMVKCKDTDIFGLNRGNPKNWDDATRMEWQCDELASILLMNKPSVLSLVNSTKDPNRGEVYYRKLLVYKMVNTYNVSAKAAELRLRHLHIIDESDKTDYGTIVSSLRICCLY